MPRPQKKKLKFTEESVNEYMQELYNDTISTRSEIKALFAKWTKHVNEGGEIAAIGKDIIGLLGSELKNQEQRIMLLKFLKEIVFVPSDKKGKGQPEGDNLNTDDKSELINFVKETLKERKLNNESN